MGGCRRDDAPAVQEVLRQGRAIAYPRLYGGQLRSVAEAAIVEGAEAVASALVGRLLELHAGATLEPRDRDLLALATLDHARQLEHLEAAEDANYEPPTTPPRLSALGILQRTLVCATERGMTAVVRQILQGSVAPAAAVTFSTQTGRWEGPPQAREAAWSLFRPCMTLQLGLQPRQHSLPRYQGR